MSLLRSATVFDPDNCHAKEACGVFGVWSHEDRVAQLVYQGLLALQHRGQESAGIAVSDGKLITTYRDMGLVSEVFDEGLLDCLRGHIALGHCRYSTTGSSAWKNAQPTFRSTPSGCLALGHNGNVINTRELAELADIKSSADGATSDTSVMTALLTRSVINARPGVTTDNSPENGGYATIEKTAVDVLPLVKGAFSLVFMDEQTLLAARDPQGFRPLVLGRLGQGWVVASETAALNAVGATIEREVEPGELVAIDEDGVRSYRFAPSVPRGCLFEYVYFARPDTTISGRSVHATRLEVGRRLAAEHPASADLVISVPESGTPSAIGYAQASGIPYGQGLVKNSYVGRTFIQPSQAARQRGIRLKFSPLRDAISGKRIIVVDDSIVRGNTQSAIVAMLRDAGATEIHVRICSPPVAWPCFYGVDFATRSELIANRLTTEEIRKFIGADSLGYISLAGLSAATTVPAERLCRACFTGEYPLHVPENEQGKHILERTNTRS
jgi:amidophosphoribosyltransferase